MDTMASSFFSQQPAAPKEFVFYSGPPKKKPKPKPKPKQHHQHTQMTAIDDDDSYCDIDKVLGRFRPSNAAEDGSSHRDVGVRDPPHPPALLRSYLSPTGALPATGFTRSPSPSPSVQSISSSDFDPIDAHSIRNRDRSNATSRATDSGVLETSSSSSDQVCQKPRPIENVESSMAVIRGPSESITEEPDVILVDRFDSAGDHDGWTLLLPEDRDIPGIPLSHVLEPASTDNKLEVSLSAQSVRDCPHGETSMRETETQLCSPQLRDASVNECAETHAVKIHAPVIRDSYFPVLGTAGGDSEDEEDEEPFVPYSRRRLTRTHPALLSPPTTDRPFSALPEDSSAGAVVEAPPPPKRRRRRAREKKPARRKGMKTPALTDEERSLGYYPARRILKEDRRKQLYLIAWDNDPETGEKFKPKWEPKPFASPALVNEWKKRRRAA